jgi:hypothetical protein
VPGDGLGLVPGDGLGLVPGDGLGLVPGDGLGVVPGEGLGVVWATIAVAPTLRKMAPMAITAHWLQRDCLIRRVCEQCVDCPACSCFEMIVMGFLLVRRCWDALKDALQVDARNQR